MPQGVAGSAAGGAVAILLLVIFVILGVTSGVYLYHSHRRKYISKQKESLLEDQEKGRITAGVKFVTFCILTLFKNIVYCVKNAHVP